MCAGLHDKYAPMNSPNFTEYVVSCLGQPDVRHGRILSACRQKDLAGEMSCNRAPATFASRSIRKSITGGQGSSQAALKTPRSHSESTNISDKNTAAITQMSRTVEDGRGNKPSYPKD